MRVLAWPIALRRAAPALAGVAALVVVDGYAGPLPIERIEARGSAEDRRVHAWMTAQGPGAVMHLPIADADLRPEMANASVQLTFHYATLLHGQPTVTGGTDFMPCSRAGCTAKDRRSARPLDADAGLEMLRRLGVRYVLLHRDEFRTPAEAESYEAGLLGPAAHVRALQSSTPCSRCGSRIRCRASRPWRRPPSAARRSALRADTSTPAVPDPAGADSVEAVRRRHLGVRRSRTAPSPRRDGPST